MALPALATAHAGTQSLSLFLSVCPQLTRRLAHAGTTAFANPTNSVPLPFDRAHANGQVEPSTPVLVRLMKKLERQHRRGYQIGLGSEDFGDVDTEEEQEEEEEEEEEPGSVPLGGTMGLAGLKALGQAARSDMTRLYSYRAVSRCVLSRLRVIGKRLRLPLDRPRGPAALLFEGTGAVWEPGTASSPQLRDRNRSKLETSENGESGGSEGSAGTPEADKNSRRQQWSELFETL